MLRGAVLVHRPVFARWVIWGILVTALLQGLFERLNERIENNVCLPIAQQRGVQLLYIPGGKLPQTSHKIEQALQNIVVILNDPCDQLGVLIGGVVRNRSEER